MIDKLVKTNKEVEYVTLKDLCIIDPSRNEIKEINPEIEVSFVMMEDLGERIVEFSPTKTKKISEVKKGGYSYFRDNDVLLAKMTPCFENGKSGIAKKLRNGIGFGSTEFYVLRSTEHMLPDLLYYIVSSDKFINNGKLSLVGTTGRRRLLKNYIETFRIPRIEISTQHRIVGLLSSIDHSITSIDEQNKAFKQLWLALINQFVIDNPKFGGLLENKTLKTYKFKDIVNKKNIKIDPIASGIERIVAGENLESEDLKIRSWGLVGEQYLGPAFHMQFDEGDILYGSRRTYLKKVAFAEFSGVCANTTYVIRSNEEYLLQDLLKHIMLSDQFTQYSIGVSKGSTNPYINWKDLDDYEFKVPDITTQKIIANLLDEVLLIMELLRKQKKILQQLKQKLLNDIFA